MKRTNTTVCVGLASFALTLGGCPTTDPGIGNSPDSTDQIGRQGPEGPAGATGATGATGASGATGAAGAAGRDGAAGAQGPAGAQGAAGQAGTDGTDGAVGADGVAGADGQLRIYGNGVDGARVISVNTDISNETISHQYTDFTVGAGQILTLPSGTTIRCTGTFTNNGTIVILASARGGQVAGIVASAQAGLASLSPTTGADANALNGAVSASCGVGGISNFSARWNLQPGFLGGSGGAATGNGPGGAGGGTLRILAQTAIVNGANGAINADGQSQQGGGGGGGVVILASRTAITNAGVISAAGGAGQDAADLGGGLWFVPACGGGGGGIVRMISPANTQSGTVSVARGAAGAELLDQQTVTTATIFGGAGGGACFGNGGSSGDSRFVPDALPIGYLHLNSPVTQAEDGFFETTIADPTALF